MLLPGKLPNALLARLLEQRVHTADPRVLLGPRVGEDAAVLDFGRSALVVAADPVTFATDDLGWYAVQVNANDVATRGARPRWFLAVLLLPENGTDERLAASIFEQITSACSALDISLVGGHTEITIGLDRPIVIGQMLGEVERERLVTSGGARSGDALLLTKGIALEGTVLLARERRGELWSRGLAADLLSRAAGLLFSPGISIVREARLATQVARIHAMHDPTEGGLATAVAEMAQAAGLGVRLERAALPILPECSAICRALDLDPLGLLASGALLLAADPSDVEEIRSALAREGISCALVGEMLPPEQGLRLETLEGPLPLPTFARDEITRALG